MLIVVVDAIVNVKTDFSFIIFQHEVDVAKIARFYFVV